MNDSQRDFGPYRLDTQRNTVTSHGRTVQLGQKAATLLQLLIDADGKTVSKHDLIDGVWPGTAVEEGNLAVQIAALRRALAPGADDPDPIMTVPRLGYRLIAPQSPAPTTAQAAPAQPTVAVLPFQCADDPGQMVFADGIVEDILAALSRFRSFAVIAYGSTRMFRGTTDPAEVARSLTVRYVLQGSVRRSGDQLRITARLTDASTGAVLWAEKFDGVPEDVFAFQDQITEGVATMVAPEIERAEIERARRERPGSLAVYDLCLQALPRILAETEAENTVALHMLEQALALEPGNATALARASWALEHRLTVGWPAYGVDDAARCVDYARRGLDHAAGDSMVMAHCAISLIQVAHDYALGLAVASAAYHDNPNNLMVATATGIAHLHCGDLDVALACFARALRLSPRDGFAHISCGGTAHVHLIRRDFPQALDWATRSQAINANFEPGIWLLIAANAHLGQTDAAQHHLARLRACAPATTIENIRNWQPHMDPERMAAILEGLRMAGLAEV